MVGICVRCGRKLTDEESIARGYGPVCYERSHGIIAKRRKTVDPDQTKSDTGQVPGQMSLEDFFGSA